MLYLPWCGAGPPRWVGKRVGGSPCCGLGATVVTLLGWSGCSDRGIQTRRLIGQAGSDWMGGGEEGLVLACRRRPPPQPSRHNSPQARPQHAGGPVCSGRGAASPPGGPMVAPGFCWPPRHLPAEPISSLPALGLHWGGLFQRSTGAVGATETGWAPQGTGFLSLLSLQASGRGARQWWRFLAQWGPFSGSGTGG